MNTNFIEIAENAARGAGQILNEMFGRLQTTDINYKGEVDLVTAADKAAEAYIVEMLRNAFPVHGIWAEESGKTSGDYEYYWVIDPLDGTTNYAHNFPWFCVSIALRRKGETVAGVVYHPQRDELFKAELGGGAFCNGAKIAVAQTDTFVQGLFVTGFPYDLSKAKTDNFERLRRVQAKSRGLRRTGSAALDLCYVAKGVFAGYWEYGLNPWDVAAGALIVTEAGGRITDTDGAPFRVEVGDVVATNGILHDELVSTLKG